MICLRFPQQGTIGQKGSKGSNVSPYSDYYVLHSV